ncbi:MAG: pitrilysin family protein [Actinomycetaceae bacterium]|nr:insulinase family protein [Arcanobacterium sp.]MDD7687322.1 pitrilysin family protein [Actinomycetaceae bacterium]MDY5274091.1 pitrilysin family protein [Arcanobacterium sp.]
MTFSTIAFPLTVPDLSFEEDGVLGRRSILPGGVRLLTEHVPGQRSVALGFWVGAGSRDEAAGAEGSTHFLEHLLFKGTSTRSSLDISTLGDFLGGTLNAATARQYTCYYGRVFATDVPQLLALLVDMFTDSTLDPQQMETERGVILEELAASEDDVSEVAENAILPMIFGSHPLARPVGATMDVVRSLDYRHMIEHYRSVYQPQELVVTAAGDVNHDQLRDLLLELLGERWQLDEAADPRPRRRVEDLIFTSGGERLIEHPGRQSAVVVGMPGLALSSSEEFTFYTLTTILGGGTSSRLFQEVREQHGLAYSTYAWGLSWLEGGVAAMEAACAPENAQAVAAMMGECLDSLAHDGVTQQEIDTAFNQRRAQLTFAFEGNGFRRDRLGQAELMRGELMSLEESLTRSRAVTAADVQALAQKLATAPRSIVVAGPAV